VNQKTPGMIAPVIGAANANAVIERFANLETLKSMRNLVSLPTLYN
jgi:hypothetical protein